MSFYIAYHVNNEHYDNLHLTVAYYTRPTPRPEFLDEICRIITLPEHVDPTLRLEGYAAFSDPTPGSTQVHHATLVSNRALDHARRDVEVMLPDVDKTYPHFIPHISSPHLLAEPLSLGAPYWKETSK